MNKLNEQQQKLVLENQKLIYKCIKDLNCYFINEDEKEEVEYYGMVGLINGVKTYNGSTTYGTYLYTCIKNNILKYFQVSEQNNKKINKIYMTSLDENIKDDTNTTYGDLIEDTNVNIEEEVEKNIKLDAIINALDKMKNKKDALAIKMYYGLENRRPMTYDEIGKEFGVSREMIRTRVNRALTKLKNNSQFLERKIFMEKPVFVDKKISSPLETINQVLIKQLLKLEELDVNDIEITKTEVIRSNAIANTSKVLLQSIGMQKMIENSTNQIISINGVRSE